MKAHFSLPTSWNQLSESQLRRALQLYGVFDSTPQWKQHVKVAMFLHLTGGSIVRHVDDGFLCSFPKEVSPVPVLIRDGLLPSVLAPLQFLDEPERITVRLDTAAGRKAVDFELRTLPFGQYLLAENFYQSFLADHTPKALQGLAAALYPSSDDDSADFAQEELLGAFLWYGAAKTILAQWFPHFFRPVSSSGDAPTISRESLHESTLAQIRLLTGGDITKQPVVLDTDTWTALAELDAQAQIAEKIKSHKP